ncbi:xylosyl- and glucuronyltransferase LARGE2s-like [Saccoglossus kowalevskii]|uniref:Glycosyltransferase-like protein LARGE2-like n=1 Tax=Saccoglossus kowalevskii TaxID=10224 RepID=A0ABM0GZN2_SACKO|nr:PREDICTED: glycosyltransferase-like protein LARGE2-like [Saccoglossus kowalevskii]
MTIRPDVSIYVLVQWFVAVGSVLSITMATKFNFNFRLPPGVLNMRANQIRPIIFTATFATQLILLFYVFSAVRQEDLIVTQTRAVSGGSGFHGCDDIHLLINIPFKDLSRNLTTTLKSLFFYRTTRLHFHYIVDQERTGYMLRTLYKTWNVPGVNCSTYYNTEFLELMKSPATRIPRLMYIDWNVIFLSDPAEIWSQFNNFAPGQAVGVVGLSYRPEDMNTNLLLLDMNYVMELNLQDVLDKIGLGSDNYDITDHNSKLHTTITSLSTTNPDALFLLPCNYNLDFTNSSMDCYLQMGNMLSFQSPESFGNDPWLNIDYHQSFRNQYFSLLDYDGNLFRHKIIGCGINIARPEKIVKLFRNGELDCSVFFMRETMILRTHTYFIGNIPTEKDSPPIEITLSLQSTFDRFYQMLERIATYWTGPISVAVYATDTQVQLIPAMFEMSQILKNRNNVAVHVGFVEREVGQYPFNHMRNIAMEEVNTTYLYIGEIDFLYKPTLYEELKDIVQWFVTSGGGMEMKALVVPAYEVNRLNVSYIPSTKAELIRLWDNEDLHLFHFWDFPQGHLPSNYTKIMLEDQPYPIIWEKGYEPYVVLLNKALPDFPLRFSGQGHDKIAFIHILVLMGYEYWVLPDCWMVHTPHWPSPSRAAWLEDVNYNQCVYAVAWKFFKDLEAKYGTANSKLFQ